MIMPAPLIRASAQRGNALIMVMVAMVLSMGLVATLIEHFAIAEARAVEESLAEIRVYWGMSGMVDYALSRAKKVTNDDLGVDPDSSTLVGYFGEIYGFDDSDERSNGYNDPDLYWVVYDEYGVNDKNKYKYQFRLNGNVVDSDDKFTFTVTLPSSGFYSSSPLDPVFGSSVPVLEKIDSGGRIPGLKVIACIQRSGVTCTTTVSEFKREFN